MIWLLFLIGLFTLYFFYRLEHSRSNKLLQKFPGPPKKIFVGDTHLFKSSRDILQNTLLITQQYGGIWYRKFGIVPALILTDLKAVAWLLGSTQHIDKSRNYRFMIPWLGTGLLTSGSSKWKQRRRIITPTFHFKILEDFIDVFNSNGTILISKLKGELGSSSFDIYRYITLCTLDIICETAMGTSINAQDNEESEYVNSVKTINRILSARSRSSWKNIDFFYTFTRDYQVEKKTLQVLHSFTDRIISTRRTELAERKNQKVEEDDFVGIKRKSAFLDMLLQATDSNGEPLTNLDIREEVDTFMFEGHDTTASAISFSLYCLANNPDVQKKALEELENLFSDDPGREPTYKDLQNMKYLEMVVKESLRIFPTVFFFSRELKEDAILDGKTIPKATTLTVFVYGIHRDPKTYPEPEKFDPERFSDENSKSRSPYAFIPFSAGSRNCVGQKFAMLEVKATISKILRNYELLPAKPNHKVILAAEIVLKPANGLNIRIQERKMIST